MAQDNLIIGIDTGGTYTDAVVIDRDQHKILSSSKALTTKGDLAVGVSEAMSLAVASLGERAHVGQVKMVSVSTTLATNAVVEGHGSAAAVVLIGFDDAMVSRTGIANAFPGMPILRIAGGHNHNGEAVCPLDEASLREAALAVKGQVGAIAIAAAFAVRNAAHELKAREIIADVLGLPVTMSSELSSALDAPRRALTAVLNARLIGHIAKLIGAVKRAMDGLGIHCPLMIMKGDGALATAESVVGRPIETVLSGPAASLVGARWLSGLDDCIVSDMGGTTTDVGVLLKGRPQVAAQGAEVGGWRTMVKAIDVRTIGLGGDSEIGFGTDGALTVGPQRATPLSLIAQRYPETLALLEGDLAETEGGSLLGKFVLLPFGGAQAAKAQGLNGREHEIFAQVTERPVPLRKLAVSSAAQRALASLRRKGLVQLAGFTPSDAAHVLGLQANWDAAGAKLGAQLMVRFRDMKMPDDPLTEQFCRQVWSETVRLTCRVLLDTAFGDLKDSATLLDAVASGERRKGLVDISLSPQVPIVAVGGPVRIYYPEVGRRLQSEVVFAPFCDVANAVGAASALVAERAVVTVEGDGAGVFRVHGGGHSEVFGSGKLAIERARVLAQDLAQAAAEARGAKMAKVSLHETLNLLPDGRDEDSLLTAIVEAEAIGAPA